MSRERSQSEKGWLTFWKRQNYGDSKNVSGLQEFRHGGGEERNEEREHRGFLEK